MLAVNYLRSFLFFRKGGFVMNIDNAARYITENILKQYSELKPLANDNLDSIKSYVIDLSDTYELVYKTAEKRLNSDC